MSKDYKNYHIQLATNLDSNVSVNTTETTGSGCFDNINATATFDPMHYITPSKPSTEDNTSTNSTN